MSSILQLNFEHQKIIVEINKFKGPPVIFIHPIGGQIYWYKEIFKVIHKNIPLYAILSPGLFEENLPLFQLEDLALFYLEAILHKFKEPHYIIVGWSFGCEVAYEITQTLLKKGKEANLILLDPQVMNKSFKNVETCFYEVLKKEYGLSSPILLNKSFSTDFTRESVQEFVIQNISYMIQMKLIDEKYKKYFEMVLKVYLYNLICMSLYKKQGKIKEMVLASPNNKTNLFSFMRAANETDWKEYVVSLSRLIIQGDHYTMLKDKAALRIGSLINENFSKIKEKD